MTQEDPGARLTLVISTLRVGGAERVMTILSNEWVRRSRSVTLLTFTAPDEHPFFPVDEGVKVVPLALDRPSENVLIGLIANVRRARTLRRAIRASRPDVVISFMDRTNIVTLVATVGLPTPIIVSERSDPAHELLRWPWPLLRDVAYRRAARVVTLSDAALAYFAAPIRRRGRVIPNPVLPLRAQATTPIVDPDGGPTVLAMGRLGREKGFDLLLEAFMSLDPVRRGWTMEIWGDGPMREQLEAARDRLGLGGVVQLPGITSQPGWTMARARLFVLSSRHEGFPAVLGEAMALGLPVVAFDCPSGPREMIRDGVDGLLVPPGDINALAQTIDRVLGDDALRARLGDRAPEILDRFSLDRVMAMWDALLAETVPGRT